jgi:hypothetical protein
MQVSSASRVESPNASVPGADRSAVYSVTETGDSATVRDVNEASYLQGPDTAHPSSKVCLRYNLATGECLDHGATAASTPRKVPCAEPFSRATITVTALITTSADLARYPPGSSDGP